MNSIKQSILFLCLFLFIGGTAFSQSTFGFKLGTHFSKWSGDIDDQFDSDEETKYAMGIHTGMTFSFPVSDILYLQPEISYLQKGIKSTSERFDYTQVIRFNYLELPILLKLVIPVSDKLTVYGNAGPAVGYALNASVVYDDGDDKDGGLLFFGGDDEFNRTEFSLHIGGGLDMKAGVGRLAVDLRYIYGMTNLSSEDDFKINNRGIGINLIYSVPFTSASSE